ncbi:jerky protein homolog-like [Haliotis rubra]|uniref:jerky protein homolog-like n=1 Tax=Haliotis rubra TaxID=36100 RepID=UPI001EE542A3|nr:jerky protein homolog-like [Haliotis rubra]
MLPDRTLSMPEEKRPAGFKKAKQRVRVLLTSNKTGKHKLKPLIIGTSQNPRCLHHVNRSILPAVYAASKNAWMTAAIFQEWFFHKFIPAVRQYLQRLEEKAILLMDNCPAHPPTTTLILHDGKIRAVLLPKNTTSLLQPMDQGIIQAYKSHYRRGLKLVQRLKCLETIDWPDQRKEKVASVLTLDMNSPVIAASVQREVLELIEDLREVIKKCLKNLRT